MTKSAGNVNFPTGTKTSLAIPVGVQIAWLASSRVMRVEINSAKPNFFQTESGIKLMLAPRSARALHLSSLKQYRMRNFPGFLSFLAIFTNEWDLGALAYSHETEGLYHIELPTPKEIHQFLQFERVDSNRIIKNKNVILLPNQVLTKELRFEQQYNLAYFVVKRIESAQATPKAHLPYACHSVSSTSAHHNRRSSSRQEDDDEDDGASRASTLSSTTYLNSLKPLNYQRYEIPSSFEQSDDLLFERQTELLNQSQEIHKEVRGGFKSLERHYEESSVRKRSEDVE
ncbi:hypothetical protein Tco_0259739 [Tanacetum coccineum]